MFSSPQEKSDSSRGLRRATGRAVAGRPQLPVIGLESEFSVYLQDQKRRPEHVFQNPQRIVREKMLPRTGRSYHLPSGGALYFDTGVIELATPIIELEAHCCLRAARCLWEQIEFLRAELDSWEERHHSRVRLQGFSGHYNVSAFDGTGMSEADVGQLSRLLAHILPVPVLLLAANRLSTGVGVRPREHRIEITADFTPDPELLTAAVALAVGISVGVMSWPSYALAELRRRGVPIIKGYKPRKHTSRKGWLGREDCFPRNPFAADPNAPDWELRDGRSMSLRQIADEITEPFKRDILAVSSPATVRHIFAVFSGRARSLLDFPERPPRYDDVGRIIDWNRRSERSLPRSRYEAVIHRVLKQRPLRVQGRSYKAERMEGWYEIIFRDQETGQRRVFNLDELVAIAGSS